MSLRKTYEPVARFGAVSNTGDRDVSHQNGVVPAGSAPCPR